MELLNGLFYWTGALVWALVLFVLFLWSIGKFTVEKVNK